MGAKELDSLYEDLGICGWYPLGIFFLLHIVGICRSFMFLGNAMVSYTPDFHCAVVAAEMQHWNASSIALLTTPSRVEEKWSVSPTSSTPAANSSSSCSENCSGNWTYSIPRSHSFVAEWDVVCDREPLKYLTEMFFYLGCLVACCFMGYLSDTYGRRTVILWSAVFGGVSGCQAFWIPSFYGYIAIRFCLGIAYTGLLSTSSYKSEIFPASWRFVAVNLDFSFIYGAMLAPGLSYLVPDWRNFCVMVSRFGSDCRRTRNLTSKIYLQMYWKVIIKILMIFQVFRCSHASL